MLVFSGKLSDCCSGVIDDLNRLLTFAYGCFRIGVQGITIQDFSSGELLEYFRFVFALPLTVFGLVWVIGAGCSFFISGKCFLEMSERVQSVI